MDVPLVLRVSQDWQRLQGIEGVCPRGLMLGSHTPLRLLK
jgi:hypothetical protein